MENIWEGGGSGRKGRAGQGLMGKQDSLCERDEPKEEKEVVHISTGFFDKRLRVDWNFACIGRCGD